MALMSRSKHLKRIHLRCYLMCVSLTAPFILSSTNVSEEIDVQTNEAIQDLSATGLLDWIKKHQNKKKQQRVAVIRKQFFDAVNNPYPKNVSANLVKFAKAQKKWLAGPGGRQLLIDLSRQRDITQRLNFLLSILPIGHQHEYFNVRRNINEALKKAEESGQPLDLSSIPNEWRDNPIIRDYQLKKTFGTDLSEYNGITPQHQMQHPVKRNQITRDVSDNFYTEEKVFESILKIGRDGFNEAAAEIPLRGLKGSYEKWLKSPAFETAVYTWSKTPSLDIQQLVQLLNRVYPASEGFPPILKTFVQFEKDVKSFLESDETTRDVHGVETLFHKHCQWMQSAYAKLLVMQHLSTSGDMKLLQDCSRFQPSYLEDPQIAFYIIAGVQSSGCQSSVVNQALELFRKIADKYPSALKQTYQADIPSFKQHRLNSCSIHDCLTRVFFYSRNAEAKRFSDVVRKLLPAQGLGAGMRHRRRRFEVFPTLHENSRAQNGENFRPKALDSYAQDAVLALVETRKTEQQKLISKMKERLQKTAGQHTGSLDSLRKESQEARKRKLQPHENTDENRVSEDVKET